MTIRRLAGLIVSATVALLLLPTGAAMAATSLTIPKTTLPVGQTMFGPVVSSATSADIVINRTGNGSGNWLNSLTAATGLDVTIQYSPDNGATWQTVCEDSTIGGTVLVGNPIVGTHAATTWELTCTWPGTGPKTQVQAIVTVSGPSSVLISGSITTA